MMNNLIYFKDKFCFEDRKLESKKKNIEFPNHLPIIIESYQNCSLPNLKKIKLIIMIIIIIFKIILLI